MRWGKVVEKPCGRGPQKSCRYLAKIELYICRVRLGITELGYSGIESRTEILKVKKC